MFGMSAVYLYPPMARPSSHQRAAVLPSQGPHPLPKVTPLVAFPPPGGAHLPPQELSQETGGHGGHNKAGIAATRPRLTRASPRPRQQRGIEGVTTGPPTYQRRPRAL